MITNVNPDVPSKSASNNGRQTQRRHPPSSHFINFTSVIFQGAIHTPRPAASYMTSPFHRERCSRRLHRVHFQEGQLFRPETVSIRFFPCSAVSLQWRGELDESYRVVSHAANAVAESRMWK